MSKRAIDPFGLFTAAPKPPSLPAPPPATTDTADPAVEAARLKALQAERKAKGRAASLIADSETLGAPPAAGKTLLGG